MSLEFISFYSPSNFLSPFGGPYTGGELNRAEAQYAQRVQNTFDQNAVQSALNRMTEAAQRGGSDGRAAAEAAAILRDNPQVGITINGDEALYGEGAAQVIERQTPSQPQQTLGLHEAGHALSAPQQDSRQQSTAANQQSATTERNTAALPPARTTLPELTPINLPAVTPLLSGQAPLVNLAELGEPPAPPTSTADVLIAARDGGVDQASVRRAALQQQATPAEAGNQSANYVDIDAFTREYGLPPLPPGMRPNPAEASLYGVRQIINTLGIDPNGSDLGARGRAARFSAVRVDDGRSRLIPR